MDTCVQIPRSLVEGLRAQGLTWLQIARQLRRRYGIPALVAARAAHGWSRTEVAQAWNERWPDEDKSFKNLQYWEAWPGPAGYPPALPDLIRLAELYQMAASDLLESVSGQSVTATR